MPINYDNRAFRGLVNTDNGEVSGETRFHYRQEGARLWANYAGGSVVTGHLLGHVNEDDSLEFVYHHINVDGELMVGALPLHSVRRIGWPVGYGRILAMDDR